MNAANYETSDVREMVNNFKRVLFTILILCAAPSMYWGVKMSHWVTVSLMAVSGCIGLASVLGLIYLRFRKNSVKALIWTQGLQMICALLALLVFLYLIVYESPLFSKAPLYLLISYPVVAILALFYGKSYAVKRWGPRVEWLGEYAHSHETVQSSELYGQFFAPPDARLQKKVILWVGISVPVTMILRHRYGDTAIGLVFSVLMTWVSFAMFSNLVIRSRLVHTFLGKRDLQWVE